MRCICEVGENRDAGEKPEQYCHFNKSRILLQFLDKFFREWVKQHLTVPHSTSIDLAKSSERSISRK